MKNLADMLVQAGNRIIDAAEAAYSLAKYAINYYMTYTPEQRAIIKRVNEARKSGKLEQMKQIKPYSEGYWKIKDALARAEDERK